MEADLRMSDGVDNEVPQLTRSLATAALAGSFGGFVFGWDLGALSSAAQSLRGWFALSPAIFGLTISFSLWGTVCGALLAGRLADRFGRRTLIAACALLYGLAAIAITLPLGLEWFLVITMRFLCGMAIGGFTVSCPLYLSELAPFALRGRLVGLFQMQVGVGVVVAFSAGSLFGHLADAGIVWKWCLGTGAIPALILLFLLRLMPADHVRFLSRASMSVSHETSSRARLFRRRNTRLILLATSIAIFNQLSGVNIVLLYMMDILSSAGISLAIGHTYTVLISCLSLATTVLGMAFIDKSGRKPLLLFGSAGMAVCLLSLGFAIPHQVDPKVYLFILVGYNAFFAFSQGTVVWVYLSELFSPGIRGAGQGYGSSIHWITNAILVSVFPIMQHTSSVRIFYFFASMMTIQIGVVWYWYPETRGTPLGSFAAAESAGGNTLR